MSLNEVNTAYKKNNGLVTDQDEMVVGITENTDTMNERVENVQHEDEKTKYDSWLYCGLKGSLECCCIGISFVVSAIVLYLSLSFLYSL